MGMHEPVIRQKVNKGAGDGQKASHVARSQSAQPKRGDHVYEAGQDSGSDAMKHPSASGFAPKGELNKGDSRGKSAPSLTDPFITTKVNAPSTPTREGGIPVPLD